MSSQPQSSQPPLGFIHLILWSQSDLFYLEIPIAMVTTLCLKPRKYLRYLGWCILGIPGTLQDEQGNVVPLNGRLVDRGVYRYFVPGENVLSHAVDLEVIRQRTHVPSEPTGSCEDFRTRLIARDGRCVWTSVSQASAMHIIPYRRGDEWFRLIVENQPHDEDLDSLHINDIRNGFYASDTLHNYFFDQRQVVVLKTPNPILRTTDIPASRRPNGMRSASVSYPRGCRYTLQWIITPDEQADQLLFPNNNDATFMNQQLPKPEDLLLHYNYGAAAVKQWGRNTSVLTDRPDIPRPPVPTQAEMGPSRVRHNRDVTIKKREAATMEGQQASRSKRRKKGKGAARDSEVQGKWDEDDIMIYFWGNSKAALERHAQKKEEHTADLEAWRAAVTGNPDMGRV